MARSMTSNNDDEYAKDDETNPSFDDEGEEGRDQVKKGPWTPEEDMILMEYVKRNGEGNWNSVQKNFGLSRCGKSCRLRWANHLRPNLKKGAFSEDEEKVIVELHAKIGNKWAKMASQLPGRTDNEIKNFWNTRLKRRQRAGLPIYPPEVNTESHAFKYQIEQCKLKNPSTSPTFSKLLKACYKNNPESAANCTPNPGNSYPPISPYNPSPSSSTLFNQNFAPPPQNNNNSGNMNMNYDHDHDFGIGSVYEPAPLMPAADSITDQISSNETPHDSATPDSSYPSPVDGLMGATSTMVNNDETQYYEVAPRLSSEGSNTGLLHDLVMEARNLSRTNDMSKSDQNSTSNGKVSRKRKSREEEEHVEVAAMKKMKSGDKAEGKKAPEEDPWAEMNFEMDDDLFSLINDFPSGMPMPEWYRNGESDPLGLETKNDNEAATAAANPSASVPNNQELAWTLGNCWNNMPGIC